MNTDLFDRAAKFAIDAHHGAERKGKGFPYILHPMEAACIVSSISTDPELLAAAMLHDTVEDTDVTIEQIRQEFGNRVASLVVHETSPLPHEAPWRDRKQALADLTASSPFDCKIVALGDKLSNLRTIATDYRQLGDTLWQRFQAPNGKEDVIWYYTILADALTDLTGTPPYEEYLALLKEIKMTITKDIYLAGGCFWGTEHYFKQIEGVVDTEVGFANGHTKNPTYKEVYTDTTGFVETVHVKYNPEVVGLEFLLKMFFKAIDPTSLNKQGHDEGTRYRTGIYYTKAEDLPTIEKVYQEEQKHYQQPLAVEKLPLENFYTAEEYHQDYLDKNPTGYCHLPQSLFEFAKKAKDNRKHGFPSPHPQ